jgi:hypothetical protein
LALYALAVIFGGVALLVPRLPAVEAYGVITVVGLSGLIAIHFLESAPYERQNKLPKSSPAS